MLIPLEKVNGVQDTLTVKSASSLSLGVFKTSAT